MRFSSLVILAASAFVVPPIARSQVFYNSLSSATGSQGFVNSSSYFGDALTLSGTSAVINSLAFRVDSISPSTATGSFQAFFYNINAGTDGVYQTGDETFGSLIGSSSSQSFSVSNGSTITLSGFSVTVPKNFLWIVYNPNLSLLISDLNSSAYSSVTGGSSAVTSGYWSSTAPANGGSLKVLGFTGTHTYGSDFAVQLSGSMVPEPSAGALLVLGVGVWAVMRRRKV